MRNVLVMSLILMIVAGCASQAPRAEKPRFRKLDDARSGDFHQKIELRIGWVPYEEVQLKEEDSGEWTTLMTESGRVDGKLPVIFLYYPDTGDSIQLDLDIDKALFGNILKHSLMTETPIKRPFMTYLQEAECAQCHPPEIKLSD